ncbi:MAG: oligosaccharide flippase family protein [Candidatus Paceibacterota bacterium]|jgi:O-antigen/teichoic acid export membrane protein
METNASTALKNTVYNFIGYLLPSIFAILITPVVVLKLGVKDYGIFIFINTILSLLNILNLGTGTATIKHVAEYFSTKQIARLKNLVYSMNTALLVIGFIGLVVCSVVGLLLPHFMPGQAVGTYSLVFVLAGLTFFFTSITSIFNLILNALQRFDLINKIGMSISTASSLASLGLVLIGFKLTAIMVSQLVFAFIALWLFSRASRKILPEAKLRYAWSLEEAIKNYKFGLATFFSNIAGTSLAYLDRLIIPIFLGPSQLTYYSLPGGITMRIPGVVGSLSGVIFPATVSLQSLGDKEKIKRLYIRSFRLLIVIACAITVSIILLAKKILLYWLSADFAINSTQVLIVLALTNMLLALYGPLINFLLAFSRFRFLTSMSFFMAGLNALCLLLLMPRFGINGAAWAYLISTLPIIYMFYQIEIRYLELKNRLSFYFFYFSKLIITSLSLAILVYYLISPQINSFPTLAIGGPLAVVLFIALYFIYGFFETDDLRDLKLLYQKITKKVIN